MQNIDCSICLQPIKNSVVLKCQHSFCSTCLNGWTLIKNNCPICRQQIKRTRIFVVFIDKTKRLLQEFFSFYNIKYFMVAVKSQKHIAVFQCAENYNLLPDFFIYKHIQLDIKELKGYLECQIQFQQLIMQVNKFISEKMIYLQQGASAKFNMKDKKTWVAVEQIEITGILLAILLKRKMEIHCSEDKQIEDYKCKEAMITY